LSDNVVENEIYKTEQYEDDTVASFLGSIESTDISTSPSLIAFPSTLTHVRTPTPTFVTPQTSTSNISQRMPSIVSMTSLNHRPQIRKVSNLLICFSVYRFI